MKKMMKLLAIALLIVSLPYVYVSAESPPLSPGWVA